MLLNRSLARVCALPAALSVVVLSAGAASAHVTITPGEGAAGAYTVLTVAFAHGCDGSPTNKIAIQMPEQLLAVSPTRHPLWDVEKVMEDLAEPVTGAHGNEITERVAQVVYTTDAPLPDGYRDSFELSLQIPDVAGETLAFPVIQTCDEGETAWIEIAPEGSDEEPEAPAPLLVVTEATGEGHGGAAAEEETEEEPAASEATPAEEGSNTMGTVGLVAGLLGLGAGAAALMQVRKRA